MNFDRLSLIFSTTNATLEAATGKVSKKDGRSYWWPATHTVNYICTSHTVKQNGRKAIRMLKFQYVNYGRIQKKMT